MTIEERYQQAIDIIQNLLINMGTATPKWEEARKLIDEERPIIKASEKYSKCKIDESKRLGRPASGFCPYCSSQRCEKAAFEKILTKAKSC